LTQEALQRTSRILELHIEKGKGQATVTEKIWEGRVLEGRKNTRKDIPFLNKNGKSRKEKGRSSGENLTGRM